MPFVLKITLSSIWRSTCGNLSQNLRYVAICSNVHTCSYCFIFSLRIHVTERPTILHLKINICVTYLMIWKMTFPTMCWVVASSGSLGKIAKVDFPLNACFLVKDNAFDSLELNKSFVFFPFLYAKGTCSHL